MDVDSDISGYFQALQNQKQMLKMAKSLQGQCVRNRTPREQMYQQFMVALMATKAKQNRKEKHMLHSSFIPPPYLPCTTPLAQLTPIAIRQLRLETHHRGTYLLLRAITPPKRMTGILVLAEDDRGDVVFLQMYQQEEEQICEATEIVDVGTILQIKEPYYKLMASGEYGLRVDHLPDVVSVNKDDPIIPREWLPRISEIDESVEIYKSRGDSAMGAGKYWKAIKEYSSALRQGSIPDRFEVIKRNRSLAYLKTKQFDAALPDTGFPNFGPNPSEKALFRAAEALYSLRRFKESISVLEILHANFPDSQQALTVLERARNRLIEESSGAYDFKLLQREAKGLRPPHLDHATYIGPVEIRKTAGKGRGLFVTRAVKAGDLLLCEKAFSHAYAPESGNANSNTTLLMNVDTEKGFMGGQADLIRLIAQKLWYNPSVAPAFTTLHHGTYKPAGMATVDGRPIVDTFLVERIMSLNVFGCPESSLATHKDVIANKPKEEKVYHSCGIWTQASYINHSCTSNARRSFIGDMMIVRATQDIESDTEITFWYHVPTGHNIKKMQEKFLGSWQFTCSCAICQDEEQTRPTVLAERRKLLEKLKRSCEVANPRNIQVGKVERLLKALNETYSRPADQVPRLLLWDPQLLLTRLYMAQGSMKKVLASMQQVLIQLGFVIAGAESPSVDFRVVKWGLVVDHLVEAFLHARDAYQATGAWDSAKRAEEYARTTYKVVVGEDVSFQSTYDERKN